MIAKIIPRKHGVGSFKDSVNYNLGLSRKDKDKVEYVNTRDIFEPSVAIQEMEALALENPLSKNPVFNCILSWRENEIPSHEQADEAVEIVLKELGLEGCQVHYALHRNTQNLHLHICVNRIDPETYKARDPAHGWTKKALERAARKIELAQGWPVEQSGRYRVTENGEILEKGHDRENVRLSQAARDIEAHTAAKSAERIAQEVAALIIRKARSWEDLHKKLAEQGISFERKGSGAILHVGETILKASHVGRDISLSKLEKRLGEYRTFEVIFGSYSPQAIERVEGNPKLKVPWWRYQEEKADYLKAKKESFAELSKRHREERNNLHRDHRQHRSALFAVSWKGRGSELNQHRSVMAARQQREQLALRDHQKEEQERMKEGFLRQFTNFKTWLLKEEDERISALFRYPGQPLILAGNQNDGVEKIFIRKKKYDLRDYSAVVGGKHGGVMYHRCESATADFIDYGKMIVFPADYDAGSVLAALQLGKQKWGAVELKGADDYKLLCVRIAVGHGIKVTNPELKADIQMFQRSKSQTRESDRNDESRIVPPPPKGQAPREKRSADCGIRETLQNTRRVFARGFPACPRQSPHLEAVIGPHWGRTGSHGDWNRTIATV